MYAEVLAQAGHPEHPVRMQAIKQSLDAEAFPEGLSLLPLPGRLAENAELVLSHPQRYLDKCMEISTCISV